MVGNMLKIEVVMLIVSWLGIVVELMDRRSSSPSEELVVSVLIGELEDEPRTGTEVVVV